MNKIKYPYGVSSFTKLITDNYILVDNTEYIAKLENLNEQYIVFLRPRRFGKSLFLSILSSYYDINQLDDFKKLFGNLFIGKNPTPKHNTYLILKFDFSGINTKTTETTFNHFLKHVQNEVEMFCKKYNLFTDEEIAKIVKLDSPNLVISSLFSHLQLKTDLAKVYVLVDEYDHFANEILSFSPHDYLDMVARNGFVRKFYEVIKTATGNGIVDRIFMTGVSPITLDSLTSGFNIATNLTLDLEFHNMLGFSHNQVKELVTSLATTCQVNIEEMLTFMQQNYNGYLFNGDAKNRIYNPNMTLYYLNKYTKTCSNPKNLVDENIMSDYGKIKKMFDLEDRNRNLQLLDILVQDKEITAIITNQFSLELKISRDDFISLLFYLGILTIKSQLGARAVLSPPNYVIEKLYLQFFAEIIAERSNLKFDNSIIYDAIYELAYDNKIANFMSIIEKTLTALSNRDAIKFDEKYIKLLMITYANLANLYYVKSEYEVEKNYLDVVFLYSVYQPKHQFIFEVKYLKKSEKKLLEAKKQEAKEQLARYKELGEIKQLENLKSYIVVFVGEKSYTEEV